jgi:hypothetical protein
LNESIDDLNTLAPAWGSGETAATEITLPVYYSWEFRTGKGGDFEELVRRLEPRELPTEVGKRPMDISDPGFTMEGETERPTILGLEGALTVVGTDSDKWIDEDREPFQQTLQTILNTPFLVATTEGDHDPIVAPPIYGCWHAAVHQVPTSEPQSIPWPPSFWLDELNLDPRNRVVAAVGTQVIQDQQEQLMASAWQQLGEVEKINQRRRQAQLSRAVNTKYHGKTFSRFSPETFFKVVAPANSRVVIEAPVPGRPESEPPMRSLLAERLGGSFVPAAAVSAPLRKIARPRGTINREYIQAESPGVEAIFTTFNAPPSARLAIRERGDVPIDRISQILTTEMQANPGFIWVPEPPPGHWERVRAGYDIMLATFRLAFLTGSSISSRQSPQNTPPGFREAAAEHHDYLTSLFTPPSAFISPWLIDAIQIKAATMTSLDPATTVSTAVNSGITAGSPPLATGDDLDPIMDAPVFPQPMYEAVRDISQDLLFPGLEHVPPNTIQLLQTNAKFIESFMVGLNSEMGRELLWRGYPTDQRGTYFQQFWDTAATTNPAPDITEIHTWGKRRLGTTAVGAGGDKIVLLVRGELLRRYPGTIIYAVKAVLNNGKREPSTNPVHESHPSFRGSLDPDVNFIGFDLTLNQVETGEGYFFVFQQQPTETRFGLDDDPFGENESGQVPALNTWNDLNWAHVAPSAAELNALSHIPVGDLELEPASQDKGVWGHNSAHMAYIVKQRLVRVAIHATEMLP